MVVAIAVFEFHLPDCRGLKEKRSFLRPLKTRLRGDFSVSAAEVAHQDLLQRAALGVAAVGPARAALEPLFERELACAKREFLVYGDIGEARSGFGESEEGGEERT